MKVLILYFTQTGHTLEAATAVCDGIRSVGSEACLVAVDDFNAMKLTSYDGLIVGSPCWYGSTGGSGVAQPITQALSSVTLLAMKGKRGGGISVHASFGGEQTVKALGSILQKKGCKDYRSGPVASAGVPLSTHKGPSVASKALKIFREFGVGFVQ